MLPQCRDHFLLPAKVQIGSKNKKIKKRKGGAKGKAKGDPDFANGTKLEHDQEPDGGDGEDAVPHTPTVEANAPDHTRTAPTVLEPLEGRGSANGVPPSENDEAKLLAMDGKAAGRLRQEEARSEDAADSVQRVYSPQSSPEPDPETKANDAGARFEVLAQERMALKDQVAELRRELEGIQQKYDGDMDTVRHQLDEITGEKEQAQTQYRNLLGKVNTIRTQLGERLKADAVGLLAPGRKQKILTPERKTWPKPKVGSRSSKSSATDFALRTKLGQRNCPPPWQKESSAQKSYRVYGTGPRYLNRTGQKKGRIWYNEKRSHVKNSRRRSRQCKIGKYWPWRSDL